MYPHQALKWRLNLRRRPNPQISEVILPAYHRRQAVMPQSGHIRNKEKMFHHEPYQQRAHQTVSSKIQTMKMIRMTL